jgi:hypothetical protein
LYIKQKDVQVILGGSSHGQRRHPLNTNQKSPSAPACSAENVRFNGGHKQSPLCSQTLSDYFDFVPLCPEVAIGLGIPREPIRLVGDPLQPQAVGTVHSAN